MKKCPCDGCAHTLGGGCCRINLEVECREGGFESWEPKEDEQDPRPLTRSEAFLKWSAIVLTALAYPLVLCKLYELIKWFYRNF